MIIIKLPYKDRKTMSEVAKLYCDLALHGPETQYAVQTFWRISMYVKAGFLANDDMETLCVALETFYDMMQENPRLNSDGEFNNLVNIIPQVRALLEEKGGKK